MYKKIRAHKTTLDLYGEKLIAEGHMTRVEADAMKTECDENGVA